VHDDAVLLRLLQESSVHLKRLEEMREASAAAVCAWPCIGVEDVGCFHRLGRVMHDGNRSGCVGLGLLQNLRVRFVSRRTAENKVKGKLLRKFKPRVGDVVPVANVHQLQ
jgi:hypothetical protein